MTVDPLSWFRDKAEELMSDALASLGTDTILPMEIPPEGMGDFAFPCFQLAKELKKSPADIAKELADKIPAGEFFEKVEASGPYVNFHIEVRLLTDTTVRSILSWREDYGTHELSSKTIILEHTSANPNGPLHVGRARNPIIGDTLARILRRCGYEVTTEFYVDDMGKQQITMTWGADNLSLDESGTASSSPAFLDKPDHRMVWFYQEASRLSTDDSNIQEKIDSMASLYEEGDEEIAGRVHDNCQKAMEGILKSLRRLDIFFDSLAWESKYVFDGSVKRVVENLKKLDCTHDDGGALYLDLGEFGIKDQETKFYLTRSDGSSLYSTRDVAYHLDKLAKYDEAIDVLGEDHRLKSKAVGFCLKLLGSDRLQEAIFYSFVSLPEGKMSTRRGRVVYLDDLMEEAVGIARKEVESRRPDLDEELKKGIAEAVGTGAIRYNIIRVQAEKPMIFRWEEALNFEGNSAPFVQYSHARASSILRKATLKEYDTSLLTHPSEAALVKALARFPSLIKVCGENRCAHPIASYSHELASLFNQFYRDCPVLIAETQDLITARLALVECSKWGLANALNTLGIIAPEEM
jgi:arginyl-tRNA synthetase